MKSLLFALSFISLTIGAFSQDTTFKISDNTEVIWQKVIESNRPFDSLFFGLKRTGLFIQLDSSSSLIIGELKRTGLDYSSFKETILVSEIPLYIKMCDFSASFELEYKVDKYRITVKNIKSIGKAENGHGFWDIKPDETSPLSFYAFKLNKKEFSKSFLKYSKPIFDKNFISFFTITQNKNDNW